MKYIRDDKKLKKFEAIIIPIYINSIGLTYFVETL